MKVHDGWSKGRGAGRGEGKRFFERGKFKFALLELLSSEPMHGYQLIKAMEEKTGGLYSPSPGSVYPNLQLLEDMQLIRSAENDGKKLYGITDEGRTFLRELGKEDVEWKKNLWEQPSHHREGGKHQLRGLMKEWSEVIHLMAQAVEVLKQHPSSTQAVRFQTLMDNFHEDLIELLAAADSLNKTEAADLSNRK